MSDSPTSLIVPLGTQVVLRADTISEQLAVPRGTVGEITKTSGDNSHAYRVRLADGFELSLRRHEFSILKQNCYRNRQTFLSKLAHQTFNGYVMSQFKKLEQDLSATGTIKWKHAMHLMRFLMSGITILREGFVPVRVDECRDALLSIRKDEMPWGAPEVLSRRPASRSAGSACVNHNLQSSCARLLPFGLKRSKSTQWLRSRLDYLIGTGRRNS